MIFSFKFIVIVMNCVCVLWIYYYIHVFVGGGWLGHIGTDGKGMCQYRCYQACHDKNCMHITVDGSDQTAFELPHFPRDDNVTSEGFKYKNALWNDFRCAMFQNNQRQCLAETFLSCMRFPVKIIWCYNTLSLHKCFLVLWIHTRQYWCDYWDPALVLFLCTTHRFASKLL